MTDKQKGHPSTLTPWKKGCPSPFPGKYDFSWIPVGGIEIVTLKSPADPTRGTILNWIARQKHIKFKTMVVDKKYLIIERTA